MRMKVNVMAIFVWLVLAIFARLKMAKFVWL